MQRKYELIVGILLLGALIAVLTARPDISAIVTEKSAEARSDIFFTYVTTRYPAKVEIIDPQNKETNFTLGISVESTILNFGSVLGKGGTVKKQINLTTRDGLSSKVSVRTYGNIVPLLRIDSSEFILRSQGTIAVTMDTMDYPEGNYTGEVDVVIQRSNNEIVRQIIGY